MGMGQKMGSLKALKASLKKGGGAGFIKYVPKNASLNVRFITEPEEWVNYLEHYDTTIRKSFPCNGEQTCPGCLSDSRKSARYLANVMNLDRNGEVQPLQMPKDLANRLVARYERKGTLTDCDYELSRAGEGLDTTYDFDPGSKGNRVAGTPPLDLLEVLEQAWNEVFNPDADDKDDAPVKPRRATVTSTRRTKATAPDHDVDDDSDEDDDDDVPEVKAKPKKKSKKKAAPEPEVDEDPEPEAAPEPEFVADDDDDDDDEGYDEDTLKALPLGALRAVAREFGVESRGRKQADIVADILAAGEPVDDEPQPDY